MSMGGTSEIWAKAVAMGLLETARNQKRDFYVVHFSDGRKKSELKCNDFSRTNQNNPMELLDFANYFEGGGTMFEPPLDKARDVIGTNQNYKKADIVFITDGQSAVRNKWLKEFKAWRDKEHVHIIGILINTGWGGSIATLREFSTKVHKLDDIMGDDALAKTMDILADI